MTAGNKPAAEERRQAALARAAQLRRRIADYLEAEKQIPTGARIGDRIRAQKRKILQILNGTEQDWNNWKWQMRNRITRIEILAQFINLTQAEIDQVNEAGKHFRWAVSPYYASLMDPDDPACPIRKQAIPSIREVEDTCGSLDPMAEHWTSPAPAITRRYPDRLIINVTNQCAMYCRHCQRRRNIGETDRQTPRKDLEAALDYIRKNPEIRDVLITGGDALLLDDNTLDWLLAELDNIAHVEIKRIGTRTPVTMPQRITDKLCAILEKHHPVYVNTQFNSPVEVTHEAALACARLAKAECPGQSVGASGGRQRQPPRHEEVVSGTVENSGSPLLYFPCQKRQRHYSFYDQHSKGNRNHGSFAGPYLRPGGAYLYSQRSPRARQDSHSAGLPALAYQRKGSIAHLGKRCLRISQ